mmetsp:Transcript_51917/g.137298  ORF Transcript_51917/g.137298 Transcript_51917/m.137298 type:complete len:166 (+) Transcript_51917:104-601(+)
MLTHADGKKRGQLFKVALPRHRPLPYVSDDVHHENHPKTPPNTVTPRHHQASPWRQTPAPAAACSNRNHSPLLGRPARVIRSKDAPIADAGTSVLLRQRGVVVIQAVMACRLETDSTTYSSTADKQYLLCMCGGNTSVAYFAHQVMNSVRVTAPLRSWSKVDQWR